MRRPGQVDPLLFNLASPVHCSRFARLLYLLLSHLHLLPAAPAGRWRTWRGGGQCAPLFSALNLTADHVHCTTLHIPACAGDAEMAELARDEIEGLQQQIDEQVRCHEPCTLGCCSKGGGGGLSGACACFFGRVWSSDGGFSASVCGRWAEGVVQRHEPATVADCRRCCCCRPAGAGGAPQVPAAAQRPAGRKEHHA